MVIQVSDIRPFPEFISHKKLKSFLSNAQQEKETLDGNNYTSNEHKETLEV